MHALGGRDPQEQWARPWDGRWRLVLFDVPTGQNPQSDGEIVAGAWDFERINRRYVRHLNVLEERPVGALRNDAAAKSLLRWAAAEREAWLDAVTNDPLLPDRILPSDYLGNRRGDDGGSAP